MACCSTVSRWRASTGSRTTNLSRSICRALTVPRIRRGSRLSSGGASATVGQDGFGIFLGPDQLSGTFVETFYLGYDDQVTGQDDDHDDLIIRASLLSPRVTSAVPEPATWAMLLTGFGLAGAAMRRRKQQREASLIRA